MARPLIVVAGAGIAISFISLTLASFLNPGGGRWWAPSGVYKNDWWSYTGDLWSERRPFTDSGDVVSRQFNWSGGDSLEINIPGVVHYEPAAEWSVVAKGRESSVERLRIDAGRIDFDGYLASPHRSSIEVHIKGPSLRHISLNGSGRVVLDRIAQTELGIDIRGSGSVEAHGSVEKLNFRLFGSGSAQLANLVTADIDASLFGSGDADVSATGDADVSIFGSGDVRLYKTPKSLSTEVIGSGRVIQ